ncbi:hypothetical protein [Spirosoma fluviale]|uniref:hypothetical protein n=1 Tax=Spirosoma fluviale TaxID=1597977 RepID=UPI000BE38844|nr:hypothetical protein [Spirosoma fluviale]
MSQVACPRGADNNAQSYFYAKARSSTTHAIRFVQAPLWGGWLVDRKLTPPVKVNPWGGWPVDRKLPNEP